MPMTARYLLGLLILLCGLVPATVRAKERLLWLIRELPPFTILDGVAQGQGVVDHLLPQLMAQMPEYEHSIIRVNRARSIQMLQEPSLTCDPTLLWTPKRARFVRFSIPSLGALSSAVMVRKQDQAMLAPFLDSQQVDLKRLLAKSRLKLGIVAERSYSAQVDDMLHQLPDTAVSRHYGNEATANLLQMQRLGRLQLVLGYWPEVRYLIQTQGWVLEDYAFHPIQGVNHYQFLYVGCSDTPHGREAIRQIDQLLPALRRGLLPELYARWLDAQQRQDYLEHSQHFFEKQPQTRDQH